jgi:predicted phosphoribosyltransferase
MMFQDREDAGRQLAEALRDYKGQDAIVLAVPRGGVPVGYQIALELGIPLDVVVTRKIPIPWNSEAGFGAVGPDGSVTLNETILPLLGLSSREIDRLAGQVFAEVQRRMRVYRGDRPWPCLEGKTALLVDDGLASGITMLAAAKSLRPHHPDRIVVASPVASASAFRLVRPGVDGLVCLYVHPEGLPFAVASFYHAWTDMTDGEVLDYLSRPTTPQRHR